MKKIILFFFLMGVGICVNAQKDTSFQQVSRNSVFLEFGGNAVEPDNGWNDPGEHFSINYERFLHTGKFVITTARLGTNLPIGNLWGRKDSHIILIGLNLIFGKRKFHFETGAVAELIFETPKYLTGYGAYGFCLGVRYLNFQKRLMCRANLTPTLGIVNGSLYASSLLGISIGYLF